MAMLFRGMQYLSGMRIIALCVSVSVSVSVSVILCIMPSLVLAGFDVGATKLDSLTKKIDWHGNYEFEYWDKEDKKDTFDAHKLVVWMGVELSKKVYVSAEIEYEHAPKLEVGDGATGGNGELKLDTAQLTYNITDNTSSHFGIFYAPFGIEYHSYPGHKNKLVTRPKAMKSGHIVPGTWSDVGMRLNHRMSGIGQVDFFVVNGDARNGGISRDSSSGGNNNKSVGMRLQFDQLMKGVNIGGSFTQGRWDKKDNFSTTLYGAHMKIETDQMSGVAYAPIFLGEYVSGSYENDSAMTNRDRDISGYYLQISSMVYKPLELAVRYGEYDSDEKVVSSEKEEISVGFTWHFYDHNVKLKGEYQWNDEQGKNKENDLFALQLVAYW